MTMTDGPGAVDVQALAAAVRSGDRAAIGRALTLVESTRDDHAAAAQELLAQLLPFTGSAQRIGITGVPGAGKSTLIDFLGHHLIEQGHRVAVLAVDPSSSISGGSILGDKTRMERLVLDDAAFVRPSPTSGTLGGVARATREAMSVLEAAGFDIVLVETVGVGQSEVAVANMVDCFVVLMLARTGDSLQGIKKGVLELADIIAVNKADGDGAQEAAKAARELREALNLVTSPEAVWQPTAVTCSGLTGDGVVELWEQVQRHRSVLETEGLIATRRAQQRVDWMWSMVRDRVLRWATSSPAVAEISTDIEQGVRQGTVPAAAGADRIIRAVEQISR